MQIEAPYTVALPQSALLLGLILSSIPFYAFRRPLVLHTVLSHSRRKNSDTADLLAGCHLNHADAQHAFASLDSGI